jgi:glycosyltransferase involved in cell wall biosynthesis
LVAEGINGYVIDDPHNADQVAEVLHHIIKEDVRRTMGKAAQETSRHYTWEKAAKSVKEIYLKILADKRRD